MITFTKIIYHGGCPDGIAAAWVFQSYYALFGLSIETFGWRYGTPAPDCTGEYVAILDFSFPRHEMEKIVSEANYVLVLDHHKTAMASLSDLPGKNITVGYQTYINLHIVFDMNKSGAQLAWEWVHKHTKTPWFISYIQDRDLWTWHLDHSREVNEWLRQGKYLTFEGLERLWTNILEGKEEIDLAYFKLQGSYYLDPRVKLITNEAKRSKLCSLHTPSGEEYIVRAIDCSYDIASDVGSQIMNMYDDCNFVLIWRYDFEEGTWPCSLRSKDEKTDVSEIAKAWGGGGHRNAAGMCIKSNISDYLKKITV